MKKITLLLIALGMIFAFNGSVFAATASSSVLEDPDIFPDVCDDDDTECIEEQEANIEECEDCEGTETIPTETDTNPKTAGEATFIIGAIGTLGAAKVFISANNKKKRI